MDEKYPYSILFIEDEAAIRQNYTQYLKMFFQAVYEAKDGEEGYRLYKEKKPDILIVDIYLPKLSGIELLQKIRKNDHQTKAIMLTAHTDTELLLEAASLKLVKYLKKPVSRTQLQNTLLQTVEELKRFSVQAIEVVRLNEQYSWYMKQKKLMHFNNEVSLTPKERDFLQLLCSCEGKTFTYEEISEHVWGYDETGSVDSIKTLVKKLRKKLPQDIIKNVFATGFKIG
jgi:DNA-binding response OmpR family regulator